MASAGPRDAAADGGTAVAVASAQLSPKPDCGAPGRGSQPAFSGFAPPEAGLDAADACVCARPTAFLPPSAAAAPPRHVPAASWDHSRTFAFPRQLSGRGAAQARSEPRFASRRVSRHCTTSATLPFQPLFARTPAASPRTVPLPPPCAHRCPPRPCLAGARLKRPGRHLVGAAQTRTAASAKPPAAAQPPPTPHLDPEKRVRDP